MKYLHLDLRALGLMRICMAIVILLDLSIRVSDLEAFYANSGAVPLTMVFENTWNAYSISLHAISGLWQIQLVLFLMAYFFAIMLMLGYRTRLFTLLSWLMLLSLHNRNSLILQGGDDLLRMVLFWSIFLPMGARYSCDAIMVQAKAEQKAFFSPACVAYVLQICYLYTGSALPFLLVVDVVLLLFVPLVLFVLLVLPPIFDCVDCVFCVELVEAVV